MKIISLSEAKETNQKFVRRRLPKVKEAIGVEDAIELIKQNSAFMIQDTKYFLSQLPPRTNCYCQNIIRKRIPYRHGGVDELTIEDCLHLLEKIQLIEKYARKEIRKYNLR